MSQTPISTLLYVLGELHLAQKDLLHFLTKTDFLGSLSEPCISSSWLPSSPIVRDRARFVNPAATASTSRRLEEIVTGCSYLILEATIIGQLLSLALSQSQIYPRRTSDHH